jgi:D-aspartate ligase
VRLRGLGNVEFKRDARDGRLKLIECNHRFTAATGLMHAAGLDLPLFVYNKLTDRPLPPVDEYRPGMTMRYPMRDLRAFAAYRRHGEISWLPWLRSIMRRHHYPVASLSDPRPVVANALRVFGRIRRVLHRRRARRNLPGNG